MPVGTYLTIQALMAMTIPGTVVVLAQLATPGGPGPQDAWSVLGAMIASVIVMHKESRGGNVLLWRGPMLSSFLASVFIGSIGPGLVFNTVAPVFMDDFAVRAPRIITWHGWAALGLVFGLCGWAIVRGVLAISSKIPNRMEAEADKRLGLSPKRENPDWIDPSKPQ